jgi:hypothetical protein
MPSISVPRSVLNFPRLSVPSASVLLTLGVAAVAAGVAVNLYHLYAAAEPSRWGSVSHDRNAHYVYAAAMATELRDGRVGAFLGVFDGGSMVWGPFHAVLLAVVLTVLGPSTTLAVVPSMAGFVLSVVLGFALVRRAVPGAAGAYGGLLAALLVAASPAVRAYATDAMLESLGLALTLLTLYATAACLDRPTRRAGVGLALGLTCLFFLKYNYWLLTLLAICTTLGLTRFSAVFAVASAVVREAASREFLRRQLLSPGNVVIVSLMAAAGWTAWTGGWSLEVGGRTVGMKSTRVVVNVAYGLALLKIALWWRRAGLAWTREHLGDVGVAVARWHIVPALVWLALPLRLRYFLWYLSFANTEGVYHTSLADTAEFYWRGFATEYCTGPQVAVAIAGLAVLGIVATFARSLRSGFVVVPVFAVLATALTLNHPNHKLRFLHTWSPVLFVLAGVAVATVLRLLTRPWAAHAVGGALLVAAGIVLGPPCVEPGRATERGHDGAAYSIREITDAYLPEVADSRKTMILGNVVYRPWAKWSFYERYGRTDGVEIDFREVGAFENTPAVFAHWVKHTACDTVVVVEIPPTSPLFEPPPPIEVAPLAGAWLRGQARFKFAREIVVPDRGRIEIWKRDS